MPTVPTQPDHGPRLVIPRHPVDRFTFDAVVVRRRPSLAALLELEVVPEGRENDR